MLKLKWKLPGNKKVLKTWEIVFDEIWKQTTFLDNDNIACFSSQAKRPSLAAACAAVSLGHRTASQQEAKVMDNVLPY